jgi:hypothetical protein
VSLFSVGLLGLGGGGGSSSGRCMPNENGFTDTADQDGPEPAEEKCASEAAERGVEEDSIRRAFGQESGNPGENESGEATGEKNEFHNEHAAERRERTKKFTGEKSGKVESMGVSVFGERAPRDRATNVFFAIAGE